MVVTVLGVSNAYDSRKGPKEEMREKINTIKALLDEVSALAEICGGKHARNVFKVTSTVLK